eukprot:6877610-Prymnesium_polylepis.1
MKPKPTKGTAHAIKCCRSTRALGGSAAAASEAALDASRRATGAAVRARVAIRDRALCIPRRRSGRRRAGLLRRHLPETVSLALLSVSLFC